MPEPRVAPYGAWESPFPIPLLTVGVVAISEIRAAGGVRWWLEGRPDEKGRQVLVRRDPDGTTTRLTPEGFNARSRVHEYGGGAYLVDGDLVVVSDFATGRLNRVVAPGELEPLTSEKAWRYADMVLDRARNRLVAVREPHLVAAHVQELAVEHRLRRYRRLGEVALRPGRCARGVSHARASAQPFQCVEAQLQQRPGKDAECEHGKYKCRCE